MKKIYILNLGLAFVLLYAGIDSFLHPMDWVGFVPSWVTNFGASQNFALHGHAAMEIILGLLLLTNWQKRWTALIIGLDILAIILANGLGRSTFLVTFRDVGLLAAAVYLFMADYPDKITTPPRA